MIMIMIIFHILLLDSHYLNKNNDNVGNIGIDVSKIIGYMSLSEYNLNYKTSVLNIFYNTF